MNKLKLGLAAIFLAAALSPAQAVVIGTANSESSLPFGTSNSGTAFVYQQVYGASNFSSAIDITSITFYDTFGTTGGTARDMNFRIYLSTQPLSVPAYTPGETLPAYAVGGQLGFPNSVPGANPIDVPNPLFDGAVPALVDGRLTFDLSTYHYDPSQGNLLLTILGFGSDSTSPLRLDFMTVAGSLMSWNQGAASQRLAGLVTGFNDEIAPVPLPAALPLFATVLAGGGLVAWRRKRKAAKLAA